MGKELLENVKGENRFWLNNGKPLNNLKELYKEFGDKVEKMSLSTVRLINKFQTLASIFLQKINREPFSI